MLKPLIVASYLVMLSACDGSTISKQLEPVAKPYQLTTLEQYQHQAKNLLNNIRAKKTPASIEAESAALVKVSQTLLNEFIPNFPQCTEYLNALLNEAATLPLLALDKIEADYHADGKLPVFGDPVCYHAKDLLVHPATVQVRARLGLRDQSAYKSAELDMIEVIAHFEQVERALDN